VKSEPAPIEPVPACHPVLWGDWERSQVRRRWFRLLRTQTVILMPHSAQPDEKEETKHQLVQTRAERAHWRLSWEKRLARNAASPSSSPPVITLHGRALAFAHAFGFHIMTAA